MVGFMCCQGDFSVHPAVSNIVSLLLAARPVNYNWISVAASLGMIARDLECDRNMIVTFLPHSEEAGRFIDETVPKAAWVAPGKMQREEHREYPLDALREAVINAVCHRDYAASGNVQIRFFDNRLQIWNPGKLPDGITVDLLRVEHASRPRNKTIARLLFLAGYIEQWGSGTLSMIAACKRDGLPEPQFQETGSDFIVTFTGSVLNALLERPELLNERQRGVIEHLKIHPPISTEEYGNIYGCTARTARRDLFALAEMGIIAVKREGRLRRYVLNPSFRSIADNCGQSRTEPGLRENDKTHTQRAKLPNIRGSGTDPGSSIRTIADSRHVAAASSAITNVKQLSRPVHPERTGVSP